MMRILIIGAHPYYNTEFYYMKALRSLGHDVTTCNQHMGVPNSVAIRSMITRTKLAKRLISKLPINRGLEKWFPKEHPDVVLVFKGEMMSKNTIEQLCKGYPTYLLYQDNFKFPILLKERIELFSGVFVTTPMKEFYYKLGAKKVVYLPMAYDPSIHRRMLLPKLYRASFVGSPYFKRYRILRENPNVDVFGPYWKLIRKKSHESVYGEEYVKVINETEVNINIFHPSNLKSSDLSARPFEILGSGGFLLSEEMPLMQKTFPKVATFKDKYDFNEKLIFYQENPYLRQENLAQMAEIINKKHTYLDRCVELIENIN